MSKELDEAYATIEVQPYITKIKELEAKIEAANKILENLAKETHPKNYVLAYQHLEHVLKIPRKEKQEVKTNGEY